MERLPVGPIKASCPLCGRRPTTVTAIEEPLLRGVGYGEARRVTVDACCGVTVRKIESIRPTREVANDHQNRTRDPHRRTTRPARQ